MNRSPACTGYHASCFYQYTLPIFQNEWIKALADSLSTVIQGASNDERKIEKAHELQKDGHPIVILSENVWLNAIMKARY